MAKLFGIFSKKKSSSTIREDDISNLLYDWIPIKKLSELPTDRIIIVTSEEKDGHRDVFTTYWDMSEWETPVDDVIAYMDFPEEYKGKSIRVE